ncbi:methyltransferase domain-containing protein [Streptomyces sp. NPDC004787]|uniref:methyltransferase domain-containing protein n=1 Tax=Streptomyces sp. NPDC004787 TaxID=3154291 RepID=UPI0033AA1075
MNSEDIYAGQEIVARMIEDGDRSFRLLGCEWQLMSGVFSPVYTYGTQFFTENIPFPVGGSFLEVGCGAGVTSVHAALAGCKSVTALDLTEEAVENTLINARRHGAGSLDARVSDVFDSLRADENYDLVFWNVPYTLVPDSYEHSVNLTRSVFDAGYASCRTYMKGVRNFLSADGRAMIGFGSVGDRSELESIAGECGWRIQHLASGRGEPDAEIEHYLLELVDLNKNQD